MSVTVDERWAIKSREAVEELRWGLLGVKAWMASAELRAAVLGSQWSLTTLLTAERDWYRRVGQWAMACRMNAALTLGYTEQQALLDAGDVLRYRFQLDLTPDEAAYVAAEILAGYASR